MFVLCAVITIFVCCWPEFLYNFLTFQTGPHCRAQLGVSVGNLSSIVSQLEARTGWARAPLSPLADSVLSQLSVSALTADCCSPVHHSAALTDSPSLHMTLSELDEQSTHTPPTLLISTLVGWGVTLVGPYWFNIQWVAVLYFFLTFSYCMSI